MTEKTRIALVEVKSSSAAINAKMQALNDKQ
jgi:hypothetical protein